MKSVTFIAAVLLLVGIFMPLPASAQSCPAGITLSPGGPGGPVPCIPISDYSGGGSSGPVYATRWGAFASDTKAGRPALPPGLGARARRKRPPSLTAGPREAAIAVRCSLTTTSVPPSHGAMEHCRHRARPARKKQSNAHWGRAPATGGFARYSSANAAMRSWWGDSVS